MLIIDPKIIILSKIEFWLIVKKILFDPKIMLVAKMFLGPKKLDVPGKGVKNL